MLAHEKLQVYGKALDLAARTEEWLSVWDKKHALVDQLSRATESILLNLAEAARQRDAPGRLMIIECSTGSALECAACLDIARIKELLSGEECYQEKHRVCEIVRMLVGLRKAWAGSKMTEEPIHYRAKPASADTAFLFFHERLEVYRAALEFMLWFVSMPGSNQLDRRLLRRVDEAGTSIALNIAEGNGRYSESDHHRFLKIAESAAVKAAVYLDLCVRRRLLVEGDVIRGREILRMISAMLGGM